MLLEKYIHIFPYPPVKFDYSIYLELSSLTVPYNHIFLPFSKFYTAFSNISASYLRKNNEKEI